MILFKASIYANIITTIKSLAQACIHDGIKFQDPSNEERARHLIESTENENTLLLSADKKYDERMSRDMEALWADESIKKQFEKRYDFHVFDGAPYFFSNLERLRPPQYVPSNEDILYCRRKTTGIVEVKFQHDGYSYNLCDVGGQRNERRKWVNCFEGVSAVLFVSSLSDFDQKCYEDDVTNRMNESLELFEQTINGQIFRNTLIILFLNKTDVFRQKIATKDLKVCFPEYDGGCDFDNACHYIEQRFLDLNKFDPDRIITHFTCAIQADSVTKVMDDVKNVVANHNANKNQAL